MEWHRSQENSLIDLWYGESILYHHACPGLKYSVMMLNYTKV